MEAEREEEDWVEVSRFTDRLAAEMNRDFLADHDIRVGLHGNPQATRMTWSASSELFRIVVAREDLERAKEALAAMTANEQHPFRGPVPTREDEEEEQEEAREGYLAPKNPLFGSVLGILVPLGSAHFYTQHTAAAKVLAVGMGAAFLLALFGGQPQLFRVWGLLVLVDVVGGFFAARRYNRRAIPNDATQAVGAFLAVVVVFAIAMILPFSR